MKRFVNTEILECIDVDKMIEEGYSMNEICDIVDRVEEMEEENYIDSLLGE